MKRNWLVRLATLCMVVAFSVAALGMTTYAEAGEMQPNGFGGFYTVEVQENVTIYMSYDANYIYVGKQILTENPETNISTVEGYDAEGNLVQIGTYDGNTGMGETTQYQADGRVEGRQEYAYDLNTKASKTVIIYSAEGAKIREGYYDGDAGTGEETYYDENGNVTRRISYFYDVNGGLQCTIYNAEGLRVQETFSDKDSQIQKTSYYNTAGLLALEDIYDGVAQTETTRGYSETGVVLSETILYAATGTGELSYYSETGEKLYWGECSFDLETKRMDVQIFNMAGVRMQEQHSDMDTGEGETIFYREDGSVEGVQKKIYDPITRMIVSEVYDSEGNRLA